MNPQATEASAKATVEDSGFFQVQARAVIDIGTTSIRMALAEIDPEGNVHPLDKLSQGVPLGKDTFTRGGIQKSTIEECVRVLSQYRKILEQYQITNSDQIRVVATSAVREASNRLAFIDRIYSATGFEVEPLDEAEVTRSTYMGVHPYLQQIEKEGECYTLVFEVGGGSTEVLLVDGCDVIYSNSYRLGSLRLREMLEKHRAPVKQVRQLMESHIQRYIDQVKQHLPQDKPIRLMAMGGDLRFATSKLISDWHDDAIAELPISDLDSFTKKTLKATTDELVQQYHITFPEAETLGTALLTYRKIAEAFGVKSLLVTNVNLRKGLLKELASRGLWTEVLREQILRSATELGKKFGFDKKHCVHVASLTQQLFQQLQNEHQLDPRYELFLYLGAMLHEIGLFISQNSFHKHTLYLIKNSEIFGLGHLDLLLVSLIARYHRRASPKPTHEGFNTLDRERRIAVAKLSAILRVADALDRSRSQRIEKFTCKREGGQLVIEIHGVDDLALEQIALEDKGTLFEEIFGLRVLLRRKRKS